ncbi:hypothetical protein CRM22_007627 [Opisthorchis felineus]|uniref:Deacetylase sirtuin-type domain-containing protein n=1 Tax=Opisthorchis felineus TaxID=147828 RepID=A0A4S2LF14_OPIFE|nr:hypothetical protein CRM22_007627 [Opisthorchis felineus]
MELLDLQHENEDLRARLQAATQAIDKKALEFIDLEKKLEEERGRMTCELEKLRERYDRLLSNHHHLSKINHELEARLLETIDAKNTEKKFLCDELEAAKSKLADCERRLSVVSAERNRYKDDCSVAVNLLQTNPDQFLPQNPKSRFVPSHSLPDARLIDQLVEHISRSRRMLVLTGAGVSTESGLPDYRSERVGLYARTDRRPVEFQTFLRNEEARRFYWARNFIGWPYFSQVQPNTSHHILADWASNKRLFAIITQNVDRLHHRAGCNRILELHGTSHYVVCLTCQHRFGRAELQQMFLELNPSWAVYDGKEKVVAPDGDVELSPSQTQGFKIPNCPQCGDGILKPDVVFFGENLPPWRKTEAAQLVDNADSLLCLGTSLQTFSSYRLILQACGRKLPVSIVNIGPTRADSLAQLRLFSRISTTLELADRLLSKCK